MSLKAKLEAVIYAAEEPVTLAQLAIIFADDAMEWKAEQEAARAEQAAETANSPVNEIFDYADTSDPAAEPVIELESAEEPTAEAEPEEGSASREPQSDETAVSDETAEPAEAAVSPESADASAEHNVVDPVAEARRAAKLRDKEVRAVLRILLDEIIDTYASEGRGIEVREIAGGFRMATKPECHDAVRAFIKGQKPPMKLSLPALETLAVVAYKQPVTAPEVNEIRGVDSSGVFGSLLARKLIATAGRKQVIGRPILYKTTKEFLLRFGLKDLAELPSMEEFEKMAAIELEETEAADAAMANAVEQESELDENASEEEAGDITTEAAEVANAESPETKSESNPPEPASRDAE
jgi:segregation and condensation protein B